ncbi:hypothetical protein GW17_00021423 [Ensete ventricosum]|nr:hypothetical protein GW17_00021423 [Ensete ventricosum]RZS06527.1 hypothetical protein BHM03_00037188 [Ensete ventricosum]
MGDEPCRELGREQPPLQVAPLIHRQFARYRYKNNVYGCDRARVVLRNLRGGCSSRHVASTGPGRGHVRTHIFLRPRKRYQRISALPPPRGLHSPHLKARDPSNPHGRIPANGHVTTLQQIKCTLTGICDSLGDTRSAAAFFVPPQSQVGSRHPEPASCRFRPPICS